MWPHFPRPHDELQIASLVALTDFRVDTGATRVVPGSNHWERGRQPQPDEIADAVVPPGGAVIYLGSTIHFAGTNSTADEWRLGAHVSLHARLAAHRGEQLAGGPARDRAHVVARAQELLGYAVHDAIADGGGYLGMVRMRDPMELLAEGALDR